MYFELEPLFNTPGMELPFDYELPAQPAELEGEGLPLAARPRVQGVFRNRAEIAGLDGTALVRLATRCDRCAVPITPELRIPLRHTLTRSLNDETNDELVLVEQTRWSPDALVWEDIVLAMPSKLLCREDCRGICPDCGQNRNEGICACAPKGDPRLAVLKDFTATAAEEDNDNGD